MALLATPLVSGCDSGTAETSYIRFSPDVPSVIVAGEPVTVTAVGRSDRRTFDRAEVLVFRGEPHYEQGGFVGDTLFAQRLDITPGVFEFSADVVITVPGDAVTQPELGWLYIVTGNGGSGTQIRLVPAP